MVLSLSLSPLLFVHALVSLSDFYFYIYISPVLSYILILIYFFYFSYLSLPSHPVHINQHPIYVLTPSCVRTCQHGATSLLRRHVFRHIVCVIHCSPLDSMHFVCFLFGLGCASCRVSSPSSSLFSSLCLLHTLSVVVCSISLSALGLAPELTCSIFTDTCTPRHACAASIHSYDVASQRSMHHHAHVHAIV